MPNKTFKSDNQSGVHPDVLNALTLCNQAHLPSYGNDPYTQQATQLLKKIFNNQNAKIIYCMNGTGANVLALKLCLKSYQSVICAKSAHINSNETGAPESMVGCKIIGIESQNGKLSPQQIETCYQWQTANGIHRSQPRMVSISQTTEYGTVYTASELKKIKATCTKLDLLLHIDACRIYNAAAFLNKPLNALTTDIGADIISLGGTKNGAMFAECVLIFNEKLQEGSDYLQKNMLQLYSKNRYIAAQFIALFTDNLWLQNAQNANNIAHYLALELEKIEIIKLVFPHQSNQLFAAMPLALCQHLQMLGYCYIWSENPPQVRFVTSFDSTKTDVDELIQAINQYNKPN